MTRMNRIAFSQNDRTLHAVLQLTHVTRPFVPLQLFNGRRRQNQRLLVQIAAEALDEVPCEPRNVIEALA